MGDVDSGFLGEGRGGDGLRHGGWGMGDGEDGDGEDGERRGDNASDMGHFMKRSKYQGGLRMLRERC